MLPLLAALSLPALAGEVHLMTDRLLYEDAQTVWVRSWHLQEPGGAPISAGRVRYRLIDPDGGVVEDLRVQVMQGMTHNGLRLHWGLLRARGRWRWRTAR